MRASDPPVTKDFHPHLFLSPSKQMHVWKGAFGRQCGMNIHCDSFCSESPQASFDGHRCCYFTLTNTAIQIAEAAHRSHAVHVINTTQSMQTVISKQTNKKKEKKPSTHRVCGFGRRQPVTQRGLDAVSKLNKIKHRVEV